MAGNVPWGEYSDPMVGPSVMRAASSEAVGVLLRCAGLLGDGLDDAHQVAHRDALVEQAAEHALHVAEGEPGAGHLLEQDRIARP